MTFYVAKTATGFVTEALAMLGLVDESSALEPFDLERGCKILGLFLKSMQGDGATLWMRRRECIDLIEGTATYALSDEGVDTVEVVQATISTPNSEPDDEITLTLISRSDYMDQTGKDTQSRPIQVWYHVDEDDGPQVTVWPTPDNSYVLKLDHRKPFSDITDPNAEIEVPDYWMEAVVAGLAKRCALPFGKGSSPDYREIKEIAKDLYDTAAAFDIVQDGGGEVRFVPGAR